MEKIHWIKLITFKYSLSDIFDFFRGNLRYYCYYHPKFKFLIRSHIKEQIDFRIDLMMDRECYKRGSCKICGCKTTHLQMANKPCEGNCYPELVNKFNWISFKNKGMIFSNNIFWYNWASVKKFTRYTKQFIHKEPINQFEDVE